MKKLFILLLYLSVCQDILSRILQCLDFQNSTLSGFLVETISRIFFMNSKINKIQSFISTKHIKKHFLCYILWVKHSGIHFYNWHNLCQQPMFYFVAGLKINLKSFLSSKQSNTRLAFYWFLLLILKKFDEESTEIFRSVPISNITWILFS